jgi:hypothetical protein
MAARMWSRSCSWACSFTASFSSLWPVKWRYAAVAETPTLRAASRSTTASGPPERASEVAASVSAWVRLPW